MGPTRLERTLIVSCMALAVAGCADNAILELHLVLPTAAEGRGYAYLELLSRDVVAASSFDDEWMGSEVDQGFVLGSSRTVQQVSVVASGEGISRMLGARLRFCSDEACEAPGDGADRREARWIFERPFHRGHRMAFRLEVPVVPSSSVPELVVVGRCAVGHGCAPETSLDDTDFCRPDGRHLCE